MVISKCQMLFTMGVIVVIIGLRSTGADTQAYINTFLKITPGISGFRQLADYKGKGVVYRALVILCKTISSDYHFYLLTIAAITGLLLVIPLSRVTQFYSESIVLFMLMGTYTWMINGIRQFLAVALTFYSITMLSEKKQVLCLLLIMIAAGIHRSAIILFPVYFISKGEAWNWKTLVFVLFGILSVVFLDRFTGLLDFATQGTEYEGYSEQFSLEEGSNPIRTLIFCVPPILAYIKRNEVQQKATLQINICINMSIIAAVVSLIANFTSGILVGAVSIYFSIYNLLLLPWLINEAYEGSSSAALKNLMYAFYSILFVMESYPYYSNILFGGRYFVSW